MRRESRPLAKGRHLTRSATVRLISDIEHFQRRVMADALLGATAAYWLRRAEDFDRVGTPACDEVALACRHRATLAPYDSLADLAHVLVEEQP